MSKYEHFDELPAWQEAKRLYNAVLDLLEQPKVPLSAGFRDRLDREALAIPNNIAEGFEQFATVDAQSFVRMARQSSREVSSMMALVQDRPKLKRIARQLKSIRQLADSCAEQLKGTPASTESANGQEELTDKEQQALEFAQKAKDLRLSFLRGLKSDHALYNSAEARAARGEAEA